jgi:hypothetical protein
MDARRHVALAITIVSLGASLARAQSDDEVVDVDVVAEPHTPVTPSAPPADLEALRSEVAALRTELEATRAQIAASTTASPEESEATAPTEPPNATPSFSPFGARAARDPLGIRIAEGIYVSSYIQAQYSGNESSRNELTPQGTPLNYDGFTLRRARLKLVGDTEYAGGVIEINGTTSYGGFQVQLRRAEGYLQYRLARGEIPLVQLGAGVMDAIFGYDLGYSSRFRVFAERALMIRAMWPNPWDVAARVSMAYRWFRLALQATNGTPVGSIFQGFAPTNFPDLLLRAGAEVPVDDFFIGAHVSALYGHGLHAGQPATNGTVGWSDRNEDGVLQNGELVGIPPRSATPSIPFERWAVGVDLEMSLRTSIGLSQLYGEVILAQNMDRSLFVSDPVLTGINQRMLGFYAAFVQELSPYALIGFRYDYYDPNSDAFDSRAGQVFAYPQTIETYSPMVGVQLPDLARLTFQYDIVRDHLGRSSSGVPTDLANNAWTVRLQVQL